MEKMKDLIMFLEAEKKLAEEMEIKHLVVVYKNEELSTTYAVTNEASNKIAEGDAQYVTTMPNVDKVRIFSADEAVDYTNMYPAIWDGYGRVFYAEKWLACDYREKVIEDLETTICVLESMQK
jgi:hypothetical protein